MSDPTPTPGPTPNPSPAGAPDLLGALDHLLNAADLFVAMLDHLSGALPVAGLGAAVPRLNAELSAARQALMPPAAG